MGKAKSERGSKAWGFAAAMVFAVAAMVFIASPAHAVTFEVNSTGDGGDQSPNNGFCNTEPVIIGIEPECTLRAAIEETNANNNDATVVDEIHFALGDSGVKTISPASTLPIITEPVVINGYTQGDDATENTLAVGNNANLRVRLDGASTQGLSRGLVITADDSVVRGLSITNFPGGAIDLPIADNTKIEGNFVGITPAGEDAGNGSGINIRGGGGSPSNGAVGNIVGGTTPAARNIISGNDFGIIVSGAGTAGNKIQGNYIGTTKSGTGDMGNNGSGISIRNGASGNTVGDDNPANGPTNAANVIAFNGLWGVDVSTSTTTGNRILSNSIFANDLLGIDLSLGGPTPNDPGDADTGANNLQNFPTLSSAVVSGNRTTIKGKLDSTPNTAFTIQFFSSPASDLYGYGEGRTFLGQANATTDASGNASFTFTAPSAGGAVSATATNILTGDTSEFSREIVKPTITPLSPKPGAKTFKRTVSIQAVVRDNVSDLDKVDIRLFVDGRARSFTYNPSNDRVSSTARNLSFKRHTVRIIATDGAGNVASRSWSFTVKKKKRR